MYHVTNCSAQNARPNWNTIEPMSIANDETYDGDLLGLPLTSFTTTLFYRQNGRHILPSKSPYPRNIHGRSYSGRHPGHHRVKIKFYKHDYHIFLMATSDTVSTNVIQVHLLCIRRNGRDQFEDELYGILLHHYRERVLTEQMMVKYFPHGRANVYKGDSDNEAYKMFVNVHFTYPIDISHGHWDIVQKSSTIGTGRIDKTFSCIKLDDLRSLWCIKHYYKAVKDKVENLDNVPKIRQILAPAQSTLKSVFHQRDDELIDKLAQMIV